MGRELYFIRCSKYKKYLAADRNFLCWLSIIRLIIKTIIYISCIIIIIVATIISRINKKIIIINNFKLNIISYISIIIKRLSSSFRCKTKVTWFISLITAITISFRPINITSITIKIRPITIKLITITITIVVGCQKLTIIVGSSGINISIKKTIIGRSIKINWYPKLTVSLINITKIIRS
jgi:hypothetical protein